MGLVTCPDCRREISDQATACIGCGRPMGAREQAVEAEPLTPIQWEYTELSRSWPHGKTGWTLYDKGEALARLTFWQRFQSSIMAELQPMLDVGWQPIGEMGPSCIQLRKYSSHEGENKADLAIGAIFTLGFALLEKTAKYEMSAVRVSLRRGKKS